MSSEEAKAAKDGGYKSRKLWGFIVVLAIGFPLAWYDKLTGNAIGLLLGLYALYVGGNLAAKQMLKGGGFRQLITSDTPKHPPETG